MPISDGLIHELEMEAQRTRRLLERLPEAKLSWKPHEKSMPLGRLATHIAELPGWGKLTLAQDVLDIGEGFTPTIHESVAEILETHDKSVAEFKETLAQTPDQEYFKTWSMKHQGREVFAAPKIGVVRDLVLSHIIHHRGQLTVFLRLLDVPLPMTFGPSADETGGFE
jgi:uncharacterized damage-inducible protein DinB